MRFTLIGEFSGLHMSLKLGLEALGHSAKVISDGDKSKAIAADIRIDKHLYWLPQGRINSIISSLLISLPPTDHVSIVSPLLLGGGRFFREALSFLFLNKIVASSSSISLCAAGSDSFWLAYCKGLSYHPFDDVSDPVPAFARFPANVLNSYIADRASVINGFTPDYYYAYSTVAKYKKRAKFLPMVGCPLLKSSPCSYSSSVLRIKILFGSNKPGFKGASFIKEALSRFSRSYSDVEIIIPSMCSALEWIHYIRECDILIDQCRTYSYGINALYGLAFGKIVLTGWKWGDCEFFNGFSPPVIPIEPSVISVYEGLEYARLTFRNGDHNPVTNSSFYDKFHSPVAVASKFVANLPPV
jgi:hypothetical protein